MSKFHTHYIKIALITVLYTRIFVALHSNLVTNPFRRAAVHLSDFTTATKPTEKCIYEIKKIPITTVNLQQQRSIFVYKMLLLLVTARGAV